MTKSLNTPVSLFKNFRDNQPENVSMQQVYNLITGGSLRENTEKYRYFRSQQFDKDAELLKKKSAGIVPSALCRGGRTRKHAVGYTGIAMADFDNIATGELDRLMQVLASDPYVYLAYITISNAGIRVFYRTDVTDMIQHKAAFTHGNDYFSELLEHQSDRQCCDLTRFSFLCHCEQAVFNPGTQVMHVEISAETHKKKAGRPHKAFQASAEKAASAVLAELEQTGKTYVEGHRNEYISGALYLMNRFGVPQEEAMQWAAVRFAGFDPQQLESIVRSVYQNTREHGSRKLPSAKTAAYNYATMEELENFISSQASIRNNVITERREIRLDRDTMFRDITDKDENSLWVRANKAGIYGAPRVFQMILNSEFVPDYNPFTDYFHSLVPWDGTTDHIGCLARTVHTTTPDAFTAYFKKWFVGIIASILNPKLVNHEILVLIGEQGKYKTTWLHRLLPPCLERYFYTKTNSNRMTKDDQFTLAEFALICFEEIDSMRASELNQLKAMITMPTVNERAAYARNKTHRPHIASFCGTGNNLRFLTDPTGNRRWLPFEVLDIDDPYACTPAYDQIYSQALALYRCGFRYWFSQEEIVELNRHNEEFETPDLEKELILMYYRKPLPGETGKFISIAGILQRINAMIKNPLSPIKIGIIMKKLGFECIRKRNGRGFCIIELSPSEMEANKQSIDSTENQRLPF